MKGDGCGEEEQARRDRRFKQVARLKGRRFQRRLIDGAVNS